MADPLSLIAVGAAVGGLASKVVESAWDSGERWLREKFGSHGIQAQERARLNAATFVNRLAQHVADLEEQHALNQEEILNTQRHPQFSALLQQTLLNAAKTDDDNKLDLLAGLVAARLVSNAETTVAMASDMASDAIARSTRRQLELMALCCFIDEVRPKKAIPTAAKYRQWLQVQLQPFEDFEFVEMDARHLVALGCASFNSASSKSLAWALKMKAGLHLLEALDEDDFQRVPIISELQCSWDMGLQGVALTSVGSIVGGLALGHIKKKDFGLPDWE